MLSPTRAYATRATLLLVFKRPALHYGKQRLAQAIGVQSALRIAEGMLQCALEDAASWPGPVVLAPANSADLRWARRLLAQPVAVEPQCPGNLGERINDLDRRLRDCSQEQLVFIGSDAPGLDQDYYYRAQRALETADVVLGPATDGGVTLMASNRPWPALDDLPWSTPQLGETLAARCADHGLSVVRLPEHSDVDEFADFAALAAGLQEDKRPARQRLLALLQGVIGLQEEGCVADSMKAAGEDAFITPRPAHRRSL